MYENKRIAVLGAGKIGEALITGMIDANVVTRKHFIATAAHKERLEQLRGKLEVERLYPMPKLSENPTSCFYV